jgi:hypothetical protein
MSDAIESTCEAYWGRRTALSDLSFRSRQLVEFAPHGLGKLVRDLPSWALGPGEYVRHALARVRMRVQVDDVVGIEA